MGSIGHVSISTISDLFSNLTLNVWTNTKSVHVGTIGFSDMSDISHVVAKVDASINTNISVYFGGLVG